MALGILVFFVNVVTTPRSGARAGNDPWLGDTLEWYTTSPPPEHNFDQVPYVTSARPLRDLRRRLAARETGAPAARARGACCARRGRAAPALAVVSGAAGLDVVHRLLAALALPPLAALVAAAWVAHRRLCPPPRPRSSSSGSRRS